MLTIVKGIPDFFFSQADFRTLRKDLADELWTVGNLWRTHVVIARK